jgi:hypothetical protein
MADICTNCGTSVLMVGRLQRPRGCSVAYVRTYVRTYVHCIQNVNGQRHEVHEVLPSLQVGDYHEGKYDDWALSGRILSRVGVTHKTGFGLDDWIYCTL